MSAAWLARRLLLILYTLLVVSLLVFAITQVPLLIYTSNIFAILGLRSLFFLLKGAVNRFEYLGHGIAIVLIFVGLKMLVEIFHIVLPVYISLLVIVACLAGSIFYSMYQNRKKAASAGYTSRAEV